MARIRCHASLLKKNTISKAKEKTYTPIMFCKGVCVTRGKRTLTCNAIGNRTAACIIRKAKYGLRKLRSGCPGRITGRSPNSKGMKRKKAKKIEKQATNVWLVCGRMTAGNKPVIKSNNETNIEKGVKI